MTENYELQKMIGAGTFGTVHEAQCRKTGKMFAVKTITKRFTGQFLESHFVRRVQHEVDIWNHMGNSLNVASLYDTFEDDTCVDLVMELCTGGELWNRIRKHDYTEQEAARIIREVLRTISQFHVSGVVMRDVKPENFLFASADKDSHLKAIDFGMAEYCDDETVLKERAGTPIYVAPEVLKMRYGQKADLWSAGILAYQLLTGRLPFVGDNGLMVSKLYMTKQIFSNKDVFRAILYADLDFTTSPWDELSPEAAQLVRSLLTRDPQRRPSALESLQHPWFKCIDDGGDGNGCGAGAAPALRDTVVQRLQRFGTYGRLKQIALRGIANVALTVAGDGPMLAEIESTFRRLDADGLGRVPYSAFVSYLKEGDFDLSETEMEQLISQMDVTREGFIQYDEWLVAMLEWQNLQASEQWDAWVERAFAAFDEDGAGKIGVRELTHMLCKDGECPMPDVVMAALREADTDHDAAISLDEFVKLVQLNRLDVLSNFEDRKRR